MKLPVAKEFLPFFIPVFVISLLFLFLKFLWIGIIGLIISGYIVYFFRDPKREIPEGEGLILSPADGKVVGVDTVVEKEFFDQKVTRISIFLSIFNVHINYAPVDGKVIYLKYNEGKFLPANSQKCTLLNENNYIGICAKDNGIKVLVRQIAGIIARRIVSKCDIGDVLAQGDQIGLIKFGSRVEVYLPSNCKVMVKKNDRVKGKLSILGVLEK